MSVPYTKRIKNDMEDIEHDSDKFISSGKYYIIHISIPNYPPENMKNFGKIFLTRNSEHQPLSTYIFENELYLIFSCYEEEKSHYLEGSHQEIISEYVSFISSETSSSEIKAHIVEFYTQTQIISYFIWKIYLNSRMYISKISDGKIDSNDIQSQTLNEITTLLGEYGVDWESLPNENKYGVFYKLKKSNEKYVISTLSEYFDARNNQKYLNYIFGNCM